MESWIKRLLIVLLQQLMMMRNVILLTQLQILIDTNNSILQIQDLHFIIIFLTL